MRITRKGGSLVFEKLTSQGLELVKSLPGSQNTYPWNYWWNKTLNNNEPVREIYGYQKVDSENKNVICLDLNTFEEKVVIQSNGRIRHFLPNQNYLIDTEPNEPQQPLWIKNLYQLKNGQAILLKKFEPKISMADFGLYKTGLIIEKKGGVTVYSLPDMKELHFKKLK